MYISDGAGIFHDCTFTGTGTRTPVSDGVGITMCICWCISDSSSLEFEHLDMIADPKICIVPFSFGCIIDEPYLLCVATASGTCRR